MVSKRDIFIERTERVLPYGGTLLFCGGSWGGLALGWSPREVGSTPTCHTKGRWSSDMELRLALKTRSCSDMGGVRLLRFPPNNISCASAQSEPPKLDGVGAKPTRDAKCVTIITWVWLIKSQTMGGHRDSVASSWMMLHAFICGHPNGLWLTHRSSTATATGSKARCW